MLSVRHCFLFTHELVLLHIWYREELVMADMDSLIVTFQTQLSDVMETVVKTAMYEVTRLVEDGLLEQLKARNQEVEALRIQLQWAEKQGAKEADKTVKTAADPVGNEADNQKEQDGLGRDQTVDDIDRLEIKSEATHEADKPAASFSPVWTPQVKADDHVTLIEDIKKEAVLPMSCSSVNLEEWGVTLGDVRPEPHLASVRNEVQDELLRHIVQRDLDPQISAKYVVSYGQQGTNTVASTTHMNALENNNKWLQVAPMAEKDCEDKSSKKAAKELESVAVTEQVTPSSPKQSCGVFGLTIKQEVIVDSEQVETHTTNKPISSSVRPTFPKQHRIGTPKLNRLSHKAFMQVIKPKGSTSFRPNSFQPVPRPIKRPLTIPMNSSSEIVHAHSQVISSAHRTPSTSKASPSSSLSVQRARLGDKPVLNRSGAPWINAKSQQSSNPLHTNPSLNVDLHLDGSRQIFRCGQCGKCFPHPSNLKSHLLTHTGERPFCCSLCGRTFTKLSNLKAHRRVHTGERPYSCMSCGKRFTQNCNLKRHQRIHLEG